MDSNTAVGNDNNDGLSVATPLLTVQKALGGTKAVAGDTVYLRGGVYRGRPDLACYCAVAILAASGTSNLPLTVAAYPGEKAILKGSWRVGAPGDSTQWAVVAEPEFTTKGFPAAGRGHIYKVEHWMCDANGNLLLNYGQWSYQSNPQQVFVSDSELVDGTALAQISWPTREVTTPPESRFPHNAGAPPGMNPTYMGTEGTLADLRAGSFFYEEMVVPDGPDTSTIYIWLPDGANPASKVVEVSVSTFILHPVSQGGDYVTLRDLAFRHSNMAAWGQGGGAIGLGEGCVLENCDIQWCDSVGVSVGPNSRLTHCLISNHGRMGFSMGSGSRAEGCFISGCNYRDFSLAWECGGTKLVNNVHGITIQFCEFTGNFGPPIWFDFTGDDAALPNVVRNNYIHHNFANPRLLLLGSSIYPCRSMIQVFVEASRNIQVFDNLISSNATCAITLGGAQNCQVYDNIITGMNSDWLCNPANPQTWYLLQAGDAWGFTLQNNDIHHNTYDNNAAGVIAVRLNTGILPAAWNIVDYNVFFSTPAGASLFDNPSSPMDFVSWQQYSGYDLNSAVYAPALNPKVIKNWLTKFHSGYTSAGSSSKRGTKK